MINRYLKEDYNFSDKLKKLGKKVFEAEDIDQSQKKQFFDEEGLSDDEAEGEQDDDDFDDELEIKEAQRALE